jgi:DNA-binding transcriptional LysR family regulator
MLNDPFDGLTHFLAVAEQKSFTAAAAQLRVTPTAVSQTIKGLERRLGVLLFQRTTRRVALTEAGASLFSRLRPAAGEIHEALAALGGFRDQPRGILRLTIPVDARHILAPIITRYQRAYPQVVLDISLNNAAVDLIAEGYDAGVRIGELLEKDMSAVRLTPDIVWCIVASPDYLARAGRPQSPEDLIHHQALHRRFITAGTIYRWEFHRDGREFSIQPPGSIISDDGEMLIGLARDGLGLAYLADFAVAEDVAAGRLECVLQPFVPVGAGLFLYFPSHTQTQPKLRAFIDMATQAMKAPAPRKKPRR